jgi:hypothetical protein
MRVFLSGSLGFKRERGMKRAGMRHRLVSFAHLNEIRDVARAYRLPLLEDRPRRRRRFRIPKGAQPRLKAR